MHLLLHEQRRRIYSTSIGVEHDVNQLDCIVILKQSVADSNTEVKLVSSVARGRSRLAALVYR